MDIFDCIPKDDTITVELFFKDKPLTNADGSVMTIEAYLPHTKEYRSARHEQSDKLIEQKKTQIKSAEAEELGLELVAKTLKGWNITFKGEQPKFSHKRALDLFKEAHFIAEQVEEARAKHEAFT